MDVQSAAWIMRVVSAVQQPEFCDMWNITDPEIGNRHLAVDMCA